MRNWARTQLCAHQSAAAGIKWHNGLKCAQPAPFQAEGGLPKAGGSITLRFHAGSCRHQAPLFIVRAGVRGMGCSTCIYLQERGQMGRWARGGVNEQPPGNIRQAVLQMPSISAYVACSVSREQCRQQGGKSEGFWKCGRGAIQGLLPPWCRLLIMWWVCSDALEEEEAGLCATKGLSS